MVAGRWPHELISQGSVAAAAVRAVPRCVVSALASCAACPTVTGSSVTLLGMPRRLHKKQHARIRSLRSAVCLHAGGVAAVHGTGRSTAQQNHSNGGSDG